MSADLSQIPLAGLSAESRHLISTLLNPPKVIPTSTGLLRDWRGLAQLCSLGGELLPAVATDPDPTNRILTILQNRPDEFTLLSLKDSLEKIGRWDVVDDSQALLVKDAEAYLERLERSQNPAQKNNFHAEKDVLTIDDLFRIRRGEQSQHYDAFLLYADEDAEFAMEMVEHLETQNSLKLCLKDRDLVAGMSFEHEAIIRLISERCNRLITILSPEFLESPANKFFVNFAQANSIDKQQERKIIPCVYKTCELPPQLTYFSKIYYNKLCKDFFWKKLLGSMTAVPPTVNNSTNCIVRVPKETKKACAEKNTLKNGFNKDGNEETVTPDGHNKKPKRDKQSRIKDLKPSRSFPFLKRVKKESNVSPQPSTSAKGSANEESILDLPSVEGVDSLSSSISGSSELSINEKSKKKKKFVKKAHPFFAM